MDNNSFLKVIYFDEAFVADFMQIIAGGELKKTTEFITEVSSDVEGDVGADAGIGTEKNGIYRIFSFLSGATTMQMSMLMQIFQESLIESQRISLKIRFLQILLHCLMQIKEELRINVVPTSKFSVI